VIVVAGGTGFIGAAVVRELVERRGRDDVVVMTTSPERQASRLADLGVPGRAGSVLDEESLAEATAGAKVVVQALTFPTFPVEKPGRRFTFEEFDHLGTNRLVDAAAANGVDKFVFVSGVGASPDSSYRWHRAKWDGEEAVRRARLHHTVIRPSWAYGPEDRALNRFAAMARRLPFVPLVGNGKQSINPVFVRDVARVIADCLDDPRTDNQTFEIGGPDVLTMREVLDTMLDVMGRRRPVSRVPAVFPKMAGFLLQRLPRPPLSPDAVDFITMDAVADLTDLRRVLDPHLTPLGVGLASYLSPIAED